MTTKTTPAVVDGNNNPTAHACRRVAMKRARPITILGAGLLISSMLLPYAAAADCISLATSTACPAFANSKISTSDALTTN